MLMSKEERVIQWTKIAFMLIGLILLSKIKIIVM